MDLERVKAYYAREDVAIELAKFGQNRELVGRFANGGYSKRPSTVFYPGDVVRMAKNGIVSFHASVELWNNPLTLETDKRSGWDFLIDLDSENLDKSRQAADALIELLKAHGVTSVFTKFSGRSGFHIFVPWKAFDSSLSESFPEIPRALGKYLEGYLKDELPKNVMGDVHIDSVAISSRHLMRAPYSLNEKSWLVSIPVKDPWFNLDDAKPENVKVKPFVLDAKKGEAMNIVDLAVDYVKRREIKPVYEHRHSQLTTKVPEEFFSPCIKKILKGLADGRKRGDFIIRAYLSNLGWNFDEIEKLVLEWNKKNKPPLRENYLKSQIRWHKRQKTKLLPPNHDRDGFYKDMGVYSVECERTKNPVVYSLRRYKDFLRYNKEEAEKKKKKDVKKKTSPLKGDST
ncbi:MAG: hypothetical protein GOU98_04925 [Candidatus Altiarchaeota archaeon]|nr:hypothetical protein [Candidatus Altiarchaeota archaeon]